MPLRIVTQDPSNKAFEPMTGLLSSTRVSLNKFMYAVQCFKDNYALNSGNPADWGEPEAITWDSMKTMVGGDMYNPSALITVYHGLKGDNVVHGFRVIKVDSKGDISPALDASPGNAPTHHLVGSNLVAMTAAEVGLWASYQAAYFSRVKVRRFGVQGYEVSLNENDDPKAVSFGWLAEIFAMMDTNQGKYPGQSVGLVLNNYATFHVDDEGRAFNGVDGFRHGLCFHACLLDDSGGIDVELLDNLSYVLPYTHRGTNLGHLCPPRCKRTDALGKL